MEQIEVGGRERWRVRADLVRVRAPAAMVHFEADVKAFGLLGALPREAQQARLLIRRQRLGLADVDLGGFDPQDGRDNRVEDIARRHHEQPDRALVPLRERHHLGQQLALGVRRRRIAERVFADVDTQDPDRHHHDVAVLRPFRARPPHG